MFINRENFMLSWDEHEKSFIISGLGYFPLVCNVCTMRHCLLTLPFDIIGTCRLCYVIVSLPRHILYYFTNNQAPML